MSNKERPMATKHCKASISVNDGNLIYVLVDERSVFDAIDLPVAEGKCLSKSLEQPGGIWIIFQFWGDQ